jgi:hypothetical protein
MGQRDRIVDITKPAMFTPRSGHRMLARCIAMSAALVVLLLMVAILLLW